MRDGYREELEQLRTALDDVTQDKEVADECDGVKQQDVIERIRTVVGTYQSIKNYYRRRNQSFKVETMKL